MRAVFPTRAEFMSKIPPSALFSTAADIRIAGLSLNILCQQYPDQNVLRQVENGTRLRCLFLDPHGSAIKAREQEEGHVPGNLTALTALNISIIQHVRERLSLEARDRLEIATYDEAIRFNIILIDDKVGVVQPYLPYARGVDAPTLLLDRSPDIPGLFSTFTQLFSELWKRSTPV